MTEPIVDKPEIPREYGDPTQRLDRAEGEGLTVLRPRRVLAWTSFQENATRFRFG